jgi:hypothetical protein
MFARNNFLLETARVTAHDHFGYFVFALCTHNPDQARTISLNASRYRQTRNNSRMVTY